MSLRPALRLVTFSCSKNKGFRVGAFNHQNNGVIDLQKHFNADKEIFAALNDMTDFISASTNSDVLAKVAKVWQEGSTALNMKDIQLQAPIRRPRRNVFCVGKNYLDHINEVKAADDRKAGNAASKPAEIPKFAQLFTKAPECVVAPGAPIESHPQLTKWLDYEAELAVIIGKEGRDIPKERAFEHVFGYSIGNDVSARDIQRRHVQFFKGKTLDGTCPLGPCIVPRAYISDAEASDLAIKLWLNDELKQNSRTSQMIFKIDDIIAQLSEGFTLRPGDVILTGTPSGVAFAHIPPFSMKTGDVVRIEIEHIGALENPVQ